MYILSLYRVVPHGTQLHSATLVISVMLLLTAFHTGILDDSHVHMPGTPDLLYVEWLG